MQGRRICHGGAAGMDELPICNGSALADVTGSKEILDADNPTNSGAAKHKEGRRSGEAQAHDRPFAETDQDGARQAGVEGRQNPAGTLSENHKVHKDHKVG